jgi:SAM-dependent methyltransferase
MDRAPRVLAPAKTFAFPTHAVYHPSQSRPPAYHGTMDVNEQMRSDWNRRAREDAYFYAAFGRRNQEKEEFLSTAAKVTGTLEIEFSRLPPASQDKRSALEIGCGPGRLMRAMSRHFGEIHGVDISDEMVRLAADQLKDIPHAHVQVTPDSTLGMFVDGSFDFVYSHIVFQHIPDRDVVLKYLSEAGRVLKPGGILRCELRGERPPDSEMKGESATWTGCYFSSDEVAAFAREHHLALVAVSGIQTQYMWVTLRKPLTRLAELDFSHVILKAVTSASGKRSVPERGKESAISLWMDGMPQAADLAQLEVGMGGVLLQGCYISPICANGGCQLNVMLPRHVPPGPLQVTLHHHDGAVLAGPVPIEVTPGPPWDPKVVSITDGINLLSKNRTDNGALKVTIEDIQRPEQVSIFVDGRPIENLQHRRTNPITFAYEFTLHLTNKVKNGERRLDISMSGRVLSSTVLTVAR